MQNKFICKWLIPWCFHTEESVLWIKVIVYFNSFFYKNALKNFNYE